ncbi:MAG: hypothetical protein U0168_27085 [Nannocystaceae bacterium]
MLALSACGKDDAGGSGGSSTTDASSSSGGDTTTTTGATTESSSSGAGSVSADSSSGTTGPVEVVISGLVQDLPLFTAIPDADDLGAGMPGFETVSGSDGAYTLAPLPADTEVFIQIEPSADHFGSIIGLQTPDADDDGQDLAQVSTMTVETQVEILQPQMPAEADLSLAIIVAAAAAHRHRRDHRHGSAAGAGHVVLGRRGQHARARRQQLRERAAALRGLLQPRGHAAGRHHLHRHAP